MVLLIQDIENLTVTRSDHWMSMLKGCYFIIGVSLNISQPALLLFTLIAELSTEVFRGESIKRIFVKDFNNQIDRVYTLNWNSIFFFIHLVFVITFS